MDFQITNGRIFHVDEQGELMAETTYVDRSSGEVDIDHTYVNPVLRGQGVASKMMETVAKHLRQEGLKATASCDYANSWLQKNRTVYADIISDNL